MKKVLIEYATQSNEQKDFSRAIKKFEYRAKRDGYASMEEYLQAREQKQKEANEKNHLNNLLKAYEKTLAKLEALNEKINNAKKH